MKQVFALLICACFLAACTAKNPADNAGPAPETAVTVETDTSDTAASGATGAASAEETAIEAQPDADTVNTPAEDIAFLRFSNTTAVESETAKDNERAVVKMTYDVPAVEKQTPDGGTVSTALSRKLSELEYSRKQERDAAFKAFTKNAASRKKQEKYDCDLRYNVFMLRADTRVFSCLEEHMLSVDTAGAAPEEEGVSYSCITHNFDAESGKDIRLTDVVKDVERLSELAADAILEKYDTTNPAYNAAKQFEGIDLQKSVLALMEDGGEDEAEGAFAWAPAYYGLRLVFSRAALCEAESLSAYLEEVSELNPRDLHCFDVTIPYTAEPSLFEASYTELPVSHIARLENGVPFHVDFGNGLQVLEIATPRKYENNTVLYTGECTVRVGENGRQSFDLIGAEEYGNLGVVVYLVKQDGVFFLYVDVTGKNGADRLQVYAIEEGNVRFVGVSGEMLDNDRLPPFDPACFMTEGIFYILPDPFVAENYKGTRGFRESYVSAGGMPKSDERFYEVAEEDVRVTAIDLELDTLKDPDDNRPVKEAYPAGTELSMWRVQQASHADFKTDDGRLVRLYINGVDTIDLIDGHELRDAFVDPRRSETD